MLVSIIYTLAKFYYLIKRGKALIPSEVTNETSPLFWKSWSFWLMILTAILGRRC